LVSPGPTFDVAPTCRNLFASERAY
jgi:hypothetical protein